MKYYTRQIALSEICQRCTSKFGFEYAFARATIFFIRDLMKCIDDNKPMHRSTYDEPVDFLDENGFIVAGNETDGYIITLA